MSSSGWAIETADLTKRFGNTSALSHVDLRVPLGSTCLLAGTNGAGKSTLLAIILNLQEPTAGTCNVLGMRSDLRGAAIRARVGYVPEETAWGYPWLTTTRMLSHVANYRPQWDFAYAAKLASVLELPLERRLGDLSKGQRRAVQIVAALAHRPDLLLLDELSDGLDPLIRDRVLEIFAGHLAETGCTAILSTHLIAEVEGLADHAAVLRSGNLLYHGPTDELVQRVRRLELDAPAEWVPPPQLLPHLLKTEQTVSRSPALVVDAPPGEVEQLVTMSGAAIRRTRPLPPSAAVLSILQAEAK